jgi:hypothetical protein
LKLYLGSSRSPYTRRSVLTVKQVLRKMKGGAQSNLVECSDGKLYTLKTFPNPQGPNLLANEVLGSVLLFGLGFPVPRWRPIWINLHSLRMFPELAAKTEVSTTPSAGLHFASEYLGSPDRPVMDLLPSTYGDRITNPQHFLGIYIFDLWASHQDDRQCIFRRSRRVGMYDVSYIDHGHLFGGPSWSEIHGECRVTYADYVAPPLSNDPKIEQYIYLFETRIPGLLKRAINLVQPEWHSGNIDALETSLLYRLTQLRDLVNRFGFRSIRKTTEPRQPLNQKRASMRNCSWH